MSSASKAIAVVSSVLLVIFMIVFGGRQPRAGNANPTQSPVSNAQPANLAVQAPPHTQPAQTSVSNGGAPPEPVPAAGAPPVAPPAAKGATALDLRRVRASVLLAEYQANEVAADQSYKGETILVTGVVDHVGKTLFGSPFVALKSGNEFDIFCVQCLFNRGEENDVASLRPGNLVSVVGKCSGKSLNVIIDDCRRLTSAEVDALNQKANDANAAKAQVQAKIAIDAAAAKAVREAKAKADADAARAKYLAEKPERDEKDAAALLQIARELDRSGMTDKAVERLEKTISDYPKTEAAKEARELLKKLTK